MAVVSMYSNKAELYARHRWRYSPEAVQAVLSQSGLGKSSTVVELGAGTGILTRAVNGKVARIFAVEPDSYMNAWILDEAPDPSSCFVITACAEAVPLPNHFADAVVVAQAIHWFDPYPARAEIQRLLKPEGWLVLMKNIGSDPDLDAALQEINTPENGVRFTQQLNRPQPQPVDFYYGRCPFQIQTFPFLMRQDWESFFCGLRSASFVPDQEDPLFERYKGCVTKVFEKYSENGFLKTHVETEIISGKIH